MTMLVVGGARSVFGAVLGTIAVATVNELLRSVENGAELFGLVSIGEAPGLAAIGLGLILLATMIAMPDGLSGGREAGDLPWPSRWVSLGSAPAVGSPRSAPRGRRPTKARAEELRAEGISLAFCRPAGARAKSTSR